MKLRSWPFAVTLLAGLMLRPGGAAAASTDYPGEDWVVERDLTRVRFENDGTSRHETTLRVRVLTDAGVRSWGQLAGAYRDRAERFEFRTVRLLRPDGTTVEVPPTAVQDLAQSTDSVDPEFPVYGDVRQKHLVVPLHAGDVLEYATFRIDEAPLVPGQFYGGYYLTRSQVTLDEQIEIDVPRERKVHWRVADGIPVVIEEKEDRRIYHVRHKATNIDEIATERKRRLRRSSVAKFDVAISTFESWKNLGSWYWGMAKEARTPTAALRAEAARLTRGLHTDLERVQALYDYVATKIRYVGLELGASSYEPHTA